jgi:hypothetical protein
MLGVLLVDVVMGLAGDAVSTLTFLERFVLVLVVEEFA